MLKILLSKHLLIGFLVFSAKELVETFFTDLEGGQEAIEAAKAKAKKLIDKNEVYYFYALRALKTGAYLCQTCPKGISKVTLFNKQVWKYGITNDPMNRYSRRHLESLGLYLDVIDKGGWNYCRNLEILHINGYQFLLESNKPECKLMKPPANPNS